MSHKILCLVFLLVSSLCAGDKLALQADKAFKQGLVLLDKAEKSDTSSVDEYDDLLLCCGLSLLTKKTTAFDAQLLVANTVPKVKSQPIRAPPHSLT